ncbi:MAG: CoA pyrophosphatase [Promethearchaeota archaeon]|nr:MAG: CoA pyrophosphatase [Candidatus Lokiarchaeota archaeon]
MLPENLIFNTQLIQRNLIPCSNRRRLPLNDTTFLHSAILFPIIPLPDRPFKIVLIHRTNRGTKHRGEISFPGGKIEPNDKTLRETAFRECEEEIGVPREEIKILGCLNDFPTMTKYIISPFVAKIDPNRKLVPEEREVQAILKVPIDFFINKTNFKEQAFNINQKKFPVYYFNYFSEEHQKFYTIWGATAYMIVTFIEMVYNYKLSELGLKRWFLKEVKDLKDFLKYRKDITKKLK